MLQYVAVCCSVMQCYDTDSKRKLNTYEKRPMKETYPKVPFFLFCSSSVARLARYDAYEACCGLLQRVAACCNVLKCVSLSHTLLDMTQIKRVAACCSVLQRVVVCCGVLQCVAVCCSVARLARYDAYKRDLCACVTACCSVLQRVAACCVCCSIL